MQFFFQCNTSYKMQVHYKDSMIPQRLLTLLSAPVSLNPRYHLYFFSPLLSFKWGFYLFPQYSIFLASYICIVSIAPCSPRGGERINKQDILFCDLWKQFNLEQKRKRNWKLQITIWSWSRDLRNHIMIRTKCSFIKFRRWNICQWMNTKIIWKLVHWYQCVSVNSILSNFVEFNSISKTWIP